METNKNNPNIGIESGAKKTEQHHQKKTEPHDGQNPKEEKPNYHEMATKLSEDELKNLFQLAQNSAFYLENLQVMRADYDNYRKRVEKEKSTLQKYANQEIIKKLIGMLDNFQRALALAPPEKVDENFLLGIRMLYTELLRTLQEFGLSEIEAIGKPFNYTCHEAYSQQEEPNYPDMTVLSELEKGYMYYDRILRPSKVMVS